MRVPPEILAVERPKNTVVCVYGKNNDKYSVRCRTGCKYDHGRRLPINGRVIGHIINGVYVPKEDSSDKKPVSQSDIALKDWGNIKLCDELAHKLLDELCEVYTRNDALKIYCIAILRVCNPGITDNELKETYETSFLSELYPGVALSKNTVSVFFKDLGKAYNKINEYMKLRTAAVENGDHVLVDGTLKTNNSEVNTLSDFSHKSAKKGSQNISILYAYDYEKGEPICSKCFPGNMPDSVSYEDFIKEFGLTRGIITGDKAFSYSCAKNYLDQNCDLHYLNPLKKNSKYIDEYDLLNYEGQLSNDSDVMYKVAKISVDGNDKWLYSFRNRSIAHKEETNWLIKAHKKGSFNMSKYDEDWLRFGILVLESDIKLTPERAYEIYSYRWEIELVMRYYKQSCEFDETRVHSDYSVIGSELCSFISSVITFRLIKAFNKSKLLEKYTYSKIMRILARAKMVHDKNDWKLIRINPSYLLILKSLGLIS